MSVQAHPVVLVTGAFGALGAALAQLLHERGASLALIDAAPTPGANLVPEQQPGRVAHLGGVDLADAAAAAVAVDQAAQALGGVDALVNIAGGFRWQTVADGDVETWDAMYRINLRTALNMCRAALPHLLARGGGGSIVNVGAGAAARAGAGMGAYAASKAGVQRLTEALAEELKDAGIRVNAVLPSIIDTPANRRDMPDADATRWVAPRELAEVIAFLLSPAARAVHGAAVAVNGRV